VPSALGVSLKLRAALAHPGSENAANPAGSFVSGAPVPDGLA
jgi:hypothetical protein